MNPLKQLFKPGFRLVITEHSGDVYSTTGSYSCAAASKFAATLADSATILRDIKMIDMYRGRKRVLTIRP